MAKHEFGIMEETPTEDDFFTNYEPQKYNCIEIHDDFIEPILMDLLSIKCFWHNLKRKEKGLAYCGITLIPPKSLVSFINILLSQSKNEYIPLINLAYEAKEKDKYIIHFGI